MSGVRLKGIVKAYGSVRVVHGIDLEVKEKEFVVLVGPSGCGKSTTLRMIAGLEEISDGDLTIDGRLVNRVAPKDRDVAMVFQNYALYPHLNVADNIAFGLRIRRESKEHIASSVAEVGGILGLTPYLERRPADLSGGQRQRVAMGRAIVRRPKVFLFDEPLSNLDAKLRTQMRAEIKRLHKRLGATSIYVTHDQVEAMTLADRIVVMHDGRIEQIGTPMELFLNPANTFVASFLGSPPMNMVKAQIEAGDRGPVAKFDGQRLSLQPLPSLQNAVGQEVTLGIRPEFVTVAADGAADRVGIDVDLVETLGSEALIHASLMGDPFVIRTDTVGQLNILDDISGFTLYPFIYIASMSMSTGFEARAGNVILTPVGFTLEAYKRVLSEPLFWSSYANTFIYTIGGTLMSLAFIIPGAYALSRPQLYGRRFWNLMVAFTMWFNAGLIPFFLNMRDLGLLDSYFGIIIGFAVSGFNIILLRNFFEGIPQSFEEAARMDGANEFQVLWKVYMPLSKPAIATVALFCIVSRWNGFFWAMVLLQDESKIPLQVYLRKVIVELSDDEEFANTLLTAAYSVETVTAAIIVSSIIPILFIYPFLQKYFSKGILLGGVKE